MKRLRVSIVLLLLSMAPVPVVPNTTAKNRQQNRRVELIISGEVIGHNITEKPAQQPVQ